MRRIFPATGNGEFRLMYSMPDLFGLQVLYNRWKSDGQYEKYGDVYACIAG